MPFTRHHAVWPRELPKSLALPRTSVFTNLEISARRYPDRNAIVFYDAPITPLRHQDRLPGGADVFDLAASAAH